MTAPAVPSNPASLSRLFRPSIKSHLLFTLLSGLALLLLYTLLRVALLVYNRELIGAYQGQYIFIDRGGVSFARTLEGGRFFALARTGDGRLAIPGAIQRDIDVSVAGPPAPVAATPAK